MGFTARGQAAIFEIEKADDWGLDAKAFQLPSASDLLASAEAQALAEIKLDLAVLKYARFARGGRLTPSNVSELFDQAPPLRDPRIVLTEIEAAAAPGEYLQSLQPKHEGFQRLRQALLKARGDSEDGEGAKPAGSDKDVEAADLRGDGKVQRRRSRPRFWVFGGGLELIDRRPPVDNTGAESRSSPTARSPSPRSGSAASGSSRRPTSTPPCCWAAEASQACEGKVEVRPFQAEPA